MMSALPSQRPLYRAYIDETGDRGVGPKSSPFFTMAAVVVADRNDRQLRAALDCIRQNVRSKSPRWKWTSMGHLERRFATLEIAKVNVRLVYVIVPKATLRASSKMAAHHGFFYNFVARLVVERISWLVARTGGACKMTFEKVKGYPANEVIDYLALLRQGNTQITWPAIHPEVRVDSPANVENLRAADIAAGAIDSAIRPDPTTGLYEPSYLFNLAPRIMRNQHGQVLGNGLKVLAPDGALDHLPWWPRRP